MDTKASDCWPTGKASKSTLDANGHQDSGTETRKPVLPDHNSLLLLLLLCLLRGQPGAEHRNPCGPPFRPKAKAAG